MAILARMRRQTQNLAEDATMVIAENAGKMRKSIKVDLPHYITNFG
jgi:phenylpyruvate tautomerase PptA (4-oxalocrotonate tautomerase family)